MQRVRSYGDGFEVSGELEACLPLRAHMRHSLNSLKGII